MRLVCGESDWKMKFRTRQWLTRRNLGTQLGPEDAYLSCELLPWIYDERAWLIAGV